MGTQRLNRQSAGIVPIAVRNTSSETAPAYGVLAIGEVDSYTGPKDFGVFQRGGTGVGAGRAIVPVRKPDFAALAGGSPAMFLIACDSPIPADQVGYATASFPTWAKVEDTLTERGALVAPKNNSWTLQEGPGYWAIKDAKTINELQYALVTLSTVSARAFRTGTLGIPGRSGDTLGEALCQPWTIDQRTLTESTGTPAKILNMSTEPVLGGKYIQCLVIDGRWVVNWEQC